MHPYELNPYELDNLKFNIPYKTKIHQGLGRKNFEKKLTQILKNYNISMFKEQLNDYGNETIHIDQLNNL